MEFKLNQEGSKYTMDRTEKWQSMDQRTQCHQNRDKRGNERGT